MTKNPALSYAYRLLARLPKTTHQCMQKMTDRWFDRLDIDNAILSLTKSWLLNDSLYTEMTIQSEIIRKGKNPFLVKQKLLQKWVEKKLIDELFVEMNEEMDSWRFEKLKRMVRSWRERGKDEQKLIQQCLRQWYPFGLVSKVLKLPENDDSTILHDDFSW